MAGGDLLGHEPVGHLWAEDLWATERPLQWLRDRGLSDSIIQEAGLGFVGRAVEGWERFQGALSIPYHDGRGREIGVRFRWSQGDQKYDQKRNTPHRLYGIHLVEEPVLYLTEGEFDSLILRQEGKAAMAVPGSTAWQNHWKWLFRDALAVYVVFDRDEAGRKGSMEVVRSLKDLTRADRVELPGFTRADGSHGNDLTDLYLARGPEGLKKALT